MNGFDIIVAMQNIDERLILDAKRHKKSAPVWLKAVSLAACICCALLLSILAINRILGPGQENIPDVLAPTEESVEMEDPRADSIFSHHRETENTDSPTAQQYLVVEDTPLKYSLPASLSGENCVEFSEDGKTMTFFDPASRAQIGYNSGRLWWINIYTREEFSALDHSYDENLRGDWYGYMSPSGYMYAMDKDHVYVLNTPTDAQYTPESSSTYFAHMEAGTAILDSIIELNSLTLNPNWSQEVIRELGLVREDSIEKWHTLFYYSSAYSLEENRVTNLTLACEAINGTVLEPGDTFSFNGVVGERTAAKGYRESTIYSSEVDKPVFGGGISQVSSTLYVCCLYSDIEIVERHGHEFQPTWVPAGRDAAVYWDTQDFSFRNSTDATLKISAYLSEGRVCIQLLSLSNEHTEAEIEAQTRVLDGQQEVLLTRRVYDLDGNLIRTDTTEALDAMGSLGTTVYSNYPDNETAEAAPVVEEVEVTPTPAAEVTAHPAYAVMEEDLVTTNGISLGMTPEEVISIMGEPVEYITYSDGSADVNYPEIYFYFGACEVCGGAHLTSFGLHTACGLMPLGFDMGTPLTDVLRKFNAEDAEPTYYEYMYRVDDTHYAYYAPLDGNGLVHTSFYAGDILYTLGFNRQNKVYICTIDLIPHSAAYICPQN